MNRKDTDEHKHQKDMTVEQLAGLVGTKIIEFLDRKGDERMSANFDLVDGRKFLLTFVPVKGTANKKRMFKQLEDVN